MPGKEAPEIRVRNKGQVTSTLEKYAEAYRQAFPDRDVRWVYNPQHKPELSGVLGRSAAGYRLVTWGELSLDIPDVKEDGSVQVADLVLMSIPLALKTRLRGEREQAAKDQLKLVSRKYYQDVEAEGSAAKPSHHSRAPVKPIGEATIAEKEFEYDVEQRGGER